MAGTLAAQIRAHRRRRATRTVAITAALALLTLGVFGFSLCWGEVVYTPGQVWQVLLGHRVPGASYAVGTLRLPRATLGLVAGLALGAGGVVFQILLRNQLASPDIIGISSGASAAGVICIVFFGLTQSVVSVIALVASLAVALVIYLTAYRGGFSATRLVLTGIGIAALLNSVVAYALSQADTWDLPTATRWLTGSLNGATWQRTLPLALTVLVLIPVLLFFSRELNVLRLGDDSATSLGVHTNRTRLVVIVTAVALVAVATAAGGPIAFVAFLSGPIALRVVGSGTSIILPAALVGALIVLVADLVGQYFLGTRYPVGVITGALGAPFLIYVLVRTNRAGASL